ncbi:hypothetical protein PoB_004036500 [Plakobranchus ocellatus]|uniref:Uncharacterized protein n=1 Tax=Plakobranchus ocellatus TaxID=259542 RepID=A0AAV4B453_9GAST|nr:hypothetical protein PoB_004036500 [Plakobranchus ocellatus]
MDGRRQLGQGRLDCITHEQQKSEKSFFRQQIEVLNLLLRSDLHYLPLYKRRWSFASYPSPLSRNKFECHTGKFKMKPAKKLYAMFATT